MQDPATLLKQSEMFRELDDDQIAAIVGLGERRCYAAETVIVEEDQPADSIFFLFSGRVDVEGGVVGRRSHVLASLAPGDVFGELSLVDGFPRSATVRATEAVEVLLLDNAKLAAHLREDTRTGFLVMRNLANILGARIRSSNRRLRSALTDLLYC